MKLLALFLISINIVASDACQNLKGKEKLICSFSQDIQGHLNNNPLSKQCDNLKNNELILVFEGGGVYSKELFELGLIKDELFRNYNIEDFPIIRPIFENYKRALFEKKKSGSYLIRLLHENNFFSIDQDVLYFSHKSVKKALSCIKGSNANKIKVLALSWGADAAQRFIRKSGLSFDSTFFIDPVRNGFLGIGALKNIFTKKNSRFFYKDKNISKMFNFYQKTDDGSLGLTKVHGNSIPSSDVNINLSKNCLLESAEAPFALVNHKSAIRCPVVLKYFKKFLSI